jgi:hypothetical protein
MSAHQRIAPRGCSELLLFIKRMVYAVFRCASAMAAEMT